MRSSFRGRFAFVYGVLAATAAFAVARRRARDDQARAAGAGAVAVDAERHLRRDGAPDRLARRAPSTPSPARTTRTSSPRSPAARCRSRARRSRSPRRRRSRTRSRCSTARPSSTRCAGRTRTARSRATPGNEIGPLLRREGLELALYTFRNVDDVSKRRGLPAAEGPAAQPGDVLRAQRAGLPARPAADAARGPTA